MSDKTGTKTPRLERDSDSQSASLDGPTSGEEVQVLVTTAKDLSLVQAVSRLLANGSRESGAVVLPRNDEFLEDIIKTGHAVMARVMSTGEVVGFGYLETWDGAEIVTHGGIVVHPQWRKLGIGRRIKRLLFETSQAHYPTKSLLSLTVHPSIIKINSEFGYRPKTFQQLTTEPRFWERCRTCNYHDTLERFSRQQCFCLGMAFVP